MIDNIVEIEQALLGHALNWPECFLEFNAEIDWRYFTVPNHKILAFCLQKLGKLGVKKPDEDSFLLVVSFYPEQNKDFGGVKYIRELKNAFNVKTENYKYFINQFKLSSVKSYIGNSKLEPFMKVLNNPKTTASQIRSCLSEMINEVNRIDVHEHRLVVLSDLEDKYKHELDERINRKFYTTGIEQLDLKLTEGFPPGKLSVIAGFTGMAKSTLVANMAHRIAVKGIGSAIFSLESPDVNVIDKIVSTITRIPTKKLMKGAKDLSYNDMQSISNAWNTLRGLPLYISHKPSITIDNMCYQIENVKQSNKSIDVVFIDLFGKLEDVDTGENLAQIIQRECKRMRIVANELNVHFIMVLQIGRSGYGLSGTKIKRPSLVSIKNANAYAEECDLVLLLHRNKYYLPDLDHPDILEIDIAKQRYGSANEKVYLEADLSTSTLRPTSIFPHDIRTVANE